MRFPILALLASAALSPPVLADEHGKTATASDKPDAVIAAITGQAGEPTGRDVHYFEPNPDTAGYLALPEGEGPFPA
ncbi:MAG: hypothetical protein R3323_00650, partial [Wenzhouxiangellaceae bacterium]|nr:hypothetical protein [Wenzhouxiangellaceae bacterium]